MAGLFMKILLTMVSTGLAEKLALVLLKEVSKYTTNTVDDKLVEVVEQALSQKVQK